MNTLQLNSVLKKRDASALGSAGGVRGLSLDARAMRMLAAELIEQRPEIESWALGVAKQLNAHVAYEPRGPQLQLARALCDCWDLFLHLRVPLFPQQAEHSEFVCRMVRLYRPALTDGD